MAVNDTLNKRIYQTITLKELLYWLLFYVVYGFIYYVTYDITIYAKEGQQNGFEEKLLNIVSDFAIKAVLSAPLWYLYFVKLRYKPVSVHFLLHLFTIPVFILAWLILHQQSSMYFGFARVQGKASAWFDYYLPLLFYLIQFALFYAHNFRLTTLNQLEKERKLQALAHEGEMALLKAQIHPHFLFNTLNNISSMIQPGQENVRIMIAQLADTFRYSLRASKLNLVKLEEEIRFLETYLSLEKERLGSRLSYRINCPKELQLISIPPMLIQPLIENALIHGIAPAAKGGSITLNISRFGNHLQFTVADTGLGYSGELDEILKQDGIGLNNIRERLMLLYGEELKVTKNDPTGLVFSFIIPVQNA
ncbi:MAG: histidine kinase [Sediminibacterium sp.]|nr:histidine kinase [Sediminibacterium sp.]